ncbi:MBL fold metallo-hydrolase [Rhabdothermincola salaria]|uniref:MBL fold metallo-hydrolase n=1 Tax=Rhabdothermincola salaria TaxID=2903142 RepID=UPI001E463286|nr:MBL fold metallo-hydrolase [Rhabdothermincola salaria]
MTDPHAHDPSAVRVPKQEQEEASTEITEVGRGILRLQLPTNFTGLGHVNTYAIEDGRGVTLVDPGLPSEESWAALLDRLAAAGIPLARVHTVYVTHSHPDHFGGAHRLVEEAGSDVLTSTMFRRWADLLDLDETPLEPRDPADEGEAITLLAAEEDLDEEARRELEASFPGLAGFRDRVRTAIAEGRLDEVAWMKVPRPTIAVDDRAVVRMGDRDWVALTTPGHTHDHLCMWSPEDGIVLSGDHVLPTITPHIGGLFGGDPLASYLENLDKVAALEGITQVLPAHGHPFSDLAGRCQAIKDHHARRLAQLADAADEVGFAGVTRWSEELFSPRSRGQMADSETHAHLEHLRLAGRAERRTVDDELQFRVLA